MNWREERGNKRKKGGIGRKSEEGYELRELNDAKSGRVAKRGEESAGKLLKEGPGGGRDGTAAVEEEDDVEGVEALGADRVRQAKIV